jgi:hypothetical protein
MTRRSRPDLGAAEHPSWCVKERCGYLVPPVMSHMLPRHRGAALRLGHPRAAGLVVAYLIGTHGLPPVVGLHAAAPVWGSGTAELRLPDAWRLARHLDVLLTQAAFVPDEGGDHARP